MQRLARTIAWAAALVSFLAGVPAEACLVAPVPAASPPGTPIVIKSDADFKTSPFVSRGSGTALDPYLIENLKIDAYGDQAITIDRTNAFFEIRNVTASVHPDPTRNTICCWPVVELINTKNGSILDSTFIGDYNGIDLHNVDGITLEGNKIRINDATYPVGDSGVLLRDASRVTMRANDLRNSTIVFEFTNASRAGTQVISDDNLVDGLPFVYGGNCVGTSIAHRELGGMMFANCTGVTVEDVQVRGDQGSLWLLFSRDSGLNGVDVRSLVVQQSANTFVTQSRFVDLRVDGFENLAIEHSEFGEWQNSKLAVLNGKELRFAENLIEDGLEVGGFTYLPGGCTRCVGRPDPVVTAAVFVGNQFHNVSTALNLVNAPGARVEGNRFERAQTAISTRGSPDVQVIGNWIEGYLGGGTGIDGEGERTLVENNTVLNVSTGIYSAQGLVVRNRVSATYAGILADISAAVEIDENQLTGAGITLQQRYAAQSPDFVIGRNNTVNGKSVDFHHAVDGVLYDGQNVGQIIALDVANVTLLNLSFADVARPIQFRRVHGFSIENLSVRNAPSGVSFESVENGRLTGSSFEEVAVVRFLGALNVTIDHNVFQNVSDGLALYSADFVRLDSNEVFNSNYAPVTLTRVSEANLTRNRLWGGAINFGTTESTAFGSLSIDETNTVDGLPVVFVKNAAKTSIRAIEAGQLIIANSTGLDVRGVTMVGNSTSVIVAQSQGVWIAQMHLKTHSRTAFAASEVEQLILEQSTFEVVRGPGEYWSQGAVVIRDTSNLTMRNVSAKASPYGAIQLYGVVGANITGSNLSDANSTIWVDQSSMVEFLGNDLAGLEIEDSNNITVGGNAFGTRWGVGMQNCRDARIVNNTFESLETVAVDIGLCQRVEIAGNQIQNSGVGIHLWNYEHYLSPQVLVHDNVIFGNQVAIELAVGAMAEARIYNNTVEANENGIRGNATVRVTVFHNRFINNTVQAQVGNLGAWDAGFPLGGNFWSDYTGKDECSGPLQDFCPFPDGYGDTPRCLAGFAGLNESFDRYPLMTPSPPTPPVLPPPPEPVTPPLLIDPVAVGIGGVLLLLLVGAAALLALSRRKGIEKLEDEESKRIEKEL